MLTIPLTTIGWIIIKAREFDGKDTDNDDAIIRWASWRTVPTTRRTTN
jgi:hypothetical protein